MARDVIGAFNGEFYFLSNFADSPIIFSHHALGLASADTVEHAFQASKTLDPERARVILANKSPGDAKRAGNDKARTVLRPNWDGKIKIPVMFRLVKIKFVQNPELEKRLLDTGDAHLIEGNNWNDTFWGVCKGRGENNLGKILMSVREELRN